MGAVNTTKVTSKVKKTFEGHNGSNRLFESGESMFDSGRSVERGKMRIVKTIILNGKSFNVVDFS
jgi:hypothetical protein|tara:strand:- start:42 stop:236 length:195 start_codon:yes stop_codon:yes gene_type:complete